MKKSIFTYSFSIIFLSALIIIVSAFVRPIMIGVTNTLDKVQTRYVQLLEEHLGLKITYESLSPSIFAGLRMQNIEFQDGEHESSLLSIDSIRLKWNVLKLLSDNPIDALGRLEIIGLNAGYNHLQHDGTIQKILQSFQLSQSASTVNVQSGEPLEDDIVMLIKTSIAPLFSLPIDVRLRNTTLSYSNESFDVKTFFSKIEFFDQDIDETLSLTIDGRVSLNTKGSISSFGDIETRVLLKGRIASDLENSVAQLNISSTSNSDYLIPRLDLHTTFYSNTFQALALQNVLPFSLEFLCDFSTSDISLSFHAEEFQPFQLISYRRENDILSRLSGSKLSGLYSLNYNWDTETTNYAAKGYTDISSDLIGEEITIDYDVTGDENIVLINYLDVLSNSIDVEVGGDFNISTLMPKGLVNIKSFTMPSGNAISSEIYIDSFENTLTIFSPQIYFGERTLTALYVDATRIDNTLNFSFEVSDYSRAEASNPGLLSANGSYDFGNEQFLQTEILSENFYISSVSELVLWCLPQEQSKSLAFLSSATTPYIFSFNAFLTSDFKSFSYSLPFAIIANTEKDDEFLLFSANGNESLFQIPSLNLLAGGQSVQAEISGDLGEDNSDIFFNSSLFFNSIPYVFSGVLIPNSFISISGDYGFNATVNFNENAGFEATAFTNSMPLLLNDNLTTVSFDTSIDYRNPTDWIAQIVSIDIENAPNDIASQSIISLAGSANANGLFLESVTYSDTLSTLKGILASSWNINESILENGTFNVSLEDAYSNEKYELNLELFNLAGVPFSSPDFLDNMFFSADALIQDSPASRFVNFQNDSNNINALLTAQGTLSNPSATLMVEDSSFWLANQTARFSGTVSLENFSITTNDVDIALGETNIKDLTGSISLNDFNGQLNGFVDARLGNIGLMAEKTLSTPVSMSLVSLGDNTDIPLANKSFKLDLVFEKLVSNFIPELENYSVEVLRTPGRFDIQAGINAELTGYILDSGEINISATEGFFVQFDAFGLIENNELTMLVENIYADASDYNALVDFPFFTLHSGIVSGSGTLTGPLNDVQINADLQGSNIEISVPSYVGERLVCETLPISVVQNVFYVEDSVFVSQETQSRVNLALALSMEQLRFTYIQLDIASFENEWVNALYEMPYGTFSGQGNVDLSLYVTNDIVEVKGLIDTREVEAIITLAPASYTPQASSTDSVIDLTVTIENQGQLYFPSKNNPIIRGLASQVEPLVVQSDTRYGTSSITGEFNMRGGEILYLNRTFFARNASAVFNESMDDFNPRLTTSAEIRERDENGDPVRILLIVENQPLKQLSPTFESIPSMSEQDIMTLLGQIIIGTSDDTTPLAILGSLADYGTQLAVFRGLEDNARDFLNLDIFSFRTMFLQNAFVNALSGSSGESLSVGDFLDSTTVYVGKFLNETLYADAMLTLIYEEDRLDLGLGGLVFQPEFGLELPSPFATIRWSIAPDLTTDWNLLVPFTSISFSWKFNF